MVYQVESSGSKFNVFFIQAKLGTSANRFSHLLEPRKSAVNYRNDIGHASAY